MVEASLVGLAGVAGKAGHPERAARLSGAAATLRDDSGLDFDPLTVSLYQQNLMVARAALGESAFTSAVAAGRGLPLAEAIAEALARPAIVEALHDAA